MIPPSWSTFAKQPAPACSPWHHTESAHFSMTSLEDLLKSKEWEGITLNELLAYQCAFI